MRVCLVSLDFPPVRSSGLTIYAERLAKRLVEGGHDVTVIAALRHGTSKRIMMDGLLVRRVAIGRSDWIAYSFRAARLVEQLHHTHPFDIVHFLDIHFAWAYRGTFVASLLQSFHQRLTADNGLPYASSWYNRLFRLAYYTAAKYLIERPTLQRAHALISLSRATAEEFINHYGVEEEHITIVPESVDMDFFAPQPAHKVDDLRRKLGLEQQRVLLYVGFSTPRKGLEYLVAGLSALPDDIRLVLVGRWEAGYREKVLAAAGTHWDRVIEAGSVADADMPCYYSLADLVVLPSLLEGFGIPALESLACGTPVIATTAGSLPEVVGECGRLVPPRDTPALVAAIRELMNDLDLRQQLTEQCRARAVDRFSSRYTCSRLIEFYNQKVLK